MDVKTYLKRIHFTAHLRPDYGTLELLLWHHLHSIPFEDLDIFYGIPIEFNRDFFFKKIVLNKRGGYCYELNTLMHWLLTKIGFEAELISARVVNGKHIGPEYGHMAIIVTVDNKKWLVDAGYGDFSLKPLALGVSKKVQFDGQKNYRISTNVIVDDANYLAAEKWNEGRKAFVTDYIFTTTPCQFSDYGIMNNHHQNSLQSHFVKNKICSVPTENGRISIVNNRVIQTIHGTKYSRHIDGSAELATLLKHNFNINFNHCVMPAYIRA